MGDYYGADYAFGFTASVSEHSAQFIDCGLRGKLRGASGAGKAFLDKFYATPN